MAKLAATYVVHIMLECKLPERPTRANLRFIQRRIQAEDSDSLLDDGLISSWPRVVNIYALEKVPVKRRRVSYDTHAMQEIREMMAPPKKRRKTGDKKKVR